MNEAIIMNETKYGSARGLPQLPAATEQPPAGVTIASPMMPLQSSAVTHWKRSSAALATLSKLRYSLSESPYMTNEKRLTPSTA